MKSELSLPEPELSPSAVTVLENRYLSRDESGEIIETPKEMLWRVAKNIAVIDVLYDPAYDNGHEPGSEVPHDSSSSEEEASLYGGQAFRGLQALKGHGQPGPLPTCRRSSLRQWRNA